LFVYLFVCFVVCSVVYLVAYLVVCLIVCFGLFGNLFAWLVVGYVMYMSAYVCGEYVNEFIMCTYIHLSVRVLLWLKIKQAVLFKNFLFNIGNFCNFRLYSTTT